MEGQVNQAHQNREKSDHYVLLRASEHACGGTGYEPGGGGGPGHWASGGGGETARERDTQGTTIQSHISPSILVYKEYPNIVMGSGDGIRTCLEATEAAEGQVKL